MSDPADLAAIAYRAYGETTGFKNFRGDPMPEWAALGDTIQRAWTAAANAVHRAVTAQPTPDGTLQISLSPDGAVVLGRADQSIAVSLQLLRRLQSPDLQGFASRRDGLVVFTGVDVDGQATEVVYREVGYNPTADPDANEGGFLLLERVS